jgi:hypothetical protein
MPPLAETASCRHRLCRAQERPMPGCFSDMSRRSTSPPWGEVPPQGMEGVIASFLVNCYTLYCQLVHRSDISHYTPNCECMCISLELRIKNFLCVIMSLIITMILCLGSVMQPDGKSSVLSSKNEKCGTLDWRQYEN